MKNLTHLLFVLLCICLPVAVHAQKDKDKDDDERHGVDRRLFSLALKQL